MAKSAKIAWGIDVGNCALKAVKLAASEEEVELLDFIVVEHEKVLTQPDVKAEEKDELISKSLSVFLEQKDTRDSHLVVSVPGQSSFARFVRLPPMDKKRIPDLAPLEARQQIPFDINDVEWDWQVLETPNSPEVELGIFAIKSDLVERALEPFAAANCMVNQVQMAPMALFNFLYYDHRKLRTATDDHAVIILDIGTENTDLVIAHGMKVWQRNIPIGGNHFTAAVQKAFKLSFTKAETIKRTAGSSKYARQIFQAMRNVFADLAAEIQRSLGYYSSGHRETRFRQVLALGNAIKLPGLIKFLQQSLSIPVKRLDNFESLKLTSDVSASQFATNLPSMATAYGLALQGLGQSLISSNLLPREIIRRTQWQRKQKWFIGAASLILASGLLSFFQAYSQQQDIRSDQTKQSLVQINRASGEVKEASTLKNNYQAKIRVAQEELDKHAKLYQPRDLMLSLYQSVLDTLPNEKNNPEQKALYEAMKQASRDQIVQIDRSEREQIFVSSVQVRYTDDLNKSFEELVRAQTIERATSGPQTSPGMMPGMMGGGGNMMQMMMMMRGGMSPGGMPGGGRGGVGPSQRSGTGAAPTEEGDGFVIVIEGHTPHKGGLSFLSPTEVGLDRSKWGFFQRLRYLGKPDEKIIEDKMKQQKSFSAQADQPEEDGSSSRRGGRRGGEKPASVSSPVPKAERPAGLAVDVPDTQEQKTASEAALGLPFETFIGSTDIEAYFDTMENGPIKDRPDPQQPIGLGIPKPRSDSESYRSRSTTRKNISPLNVYIDPLTFEPISETYKRDEQGLIEIDPATGDPLRESHDYWFRVKMKVKLKESKLEKKSSDEGGSKKKKKEKEE